MSTDTEFVEFADDRTWLEAESLWLEQTREACCALEPAQRQAMEAAAALTRAVIDRRLAVWTARRRLSGIDRLCAGLDVGPAERWILQTLAADRVKRDLLPPQHAFPHSMDTLVDLAGGPAAAASMDLLKHLRPSAPLLARRWVRTFDSTYGVAVSVEISDQAFSVVVGEPLPLATSMYCTVRDLLGATAVDSNPAPRRPTGVGDIDEVLGGGLAPAELVLLAGGPGIGKTAVALGLAWRMARRGGTTLYCGNEYRLVDLAQRLAKLIVPGIGKTDPECYAPQFARLAEGLAKSQFAFEAQGMDVAAIADRCATVAGQKGPLALVVVDSLQLVDDRSGGPLAALKRLAVELGAPVVVTSQVPRAVGLRAVKRPRPVDLRLSAPEFQVVDRFVCLYRDECHEPDSETPGMMEVAAHDRRRVTRVLTPFDSESGRIGPPEAWER
jgi:hypothetical protein